MEGNLWAACATIAQTLSTPAAKRESVRGVRLASMSLLRRWPPVVLASFVALAWPAIASAQRPSQAGARVAAGSDDSVRIGCSGGVTGAGTGNTITQSGNLSTYDMPLGAPATHTPLRRDSAAAAAVFRELDRVRFRKLRFNRISNMTCVLELVDSHGEHTVSWPIGSPPSELAPVLAALGRAFGDDRRMWR